MSEVGAITDVVGIRVGHSTRIGDGWLTGVTVVLPPPGTLGSVDVRGGAPGTHETDALAVGAAAPYPHALVLTGGSAYGLVAAAGVQRWCAQQGLGHPVGPLPHQVVPVVPAAAVYDLGRGGDFGAHPTLEMGYEAALAAGASSSGGPVARGTVGAGTGATVVNEAFKGGVGTASVRVPVTDGEVVVGALVVVNAFGTPVTPGAVAELPPRVGGQAAPPLNTVLVVVATDARLSGGQLHRTASAGHDGLARALDPTHTLADGDTVFALATGAVVLPGDDGTGDPRPVRDVLLAIQAASAHAVQAAVIDAVRSATAVLTPAVDLVPYPLAPLGDS